MRWKPHRYGFIREYRNNNSQYPWPSWGQSGCINISNISIIIIHQEWITLLRDHHQDFIWTWHLTTLFRARKTRSHQKCTGRFDITYNTYSYEIKIPKWRKYGGNYFHFLNLTLPRRWDCLCRQVVKNSEFWLRLAPAGLNMIRYFSSRHNLQMLVAGL